MPQRWHAASCLRIDQLLCHQRSTDISQLDRLLLGPGHYASCCLPCTPASNLVASLSWLSVSLKRCCTAVARLTASCLLPSVRTAMPTISGRV